MVERRKIGLSGIESSIIGLGALHMGVYLDVGESMDLIHCARDLGINFIDTSPAYGGGQSESIVGMATEHDRSSYLIATKVGFLPSFDSTGQFRSIPRSLTAENLWASVQESLAALRTDYIDLLQLHAFDYETPIDETASTLERLLSAGYIRSVGGSNYLLHELDRACDALAEHGMNLSSCQIPLNIFERRIARSLAVAAPKHHTSLISYRTVGRGLLSGKYQVGQPPPVGSRASLSARVERSLTPARLAAVRELQLFANARGRTAIELSVAWCLRQQDVAVALVGARDPEQLAVSARGAEWRLSDDEAGQVDLLLDRHGILRDAFDAPEGFL